MGKNLEGKMRASQIVREAGMVNRPEYFCDRGATSSDLNDQILERVYVVINREYGEDVSRQFVQMVADIPVLSATDFLNTLYGFESHGWSWDKNLASKGGVDVGPDDGEGSREMICKCVVVNVLSGSHRGDETGQIRGHFLARHGVENPSSNKKDVHGFYSWP